MCRNSKVQTDDFKKHASLNSFLGMAGGDTLAVGSQNGSLYLYKSTREGLVYTRYTKMKGEQPLSAIDWAESGRYLQTVTSEYDMTFCESRGETMSITMEVLLRRRCCVWCNTEAATPPQPLH